MNIQELYRLMKNDPSLKDHFDRKHLTGYYEYKGEEYPFIVFEIYKHEYRVFFIIPERVYKSYEECTSCMGYILIHAYICYSPSYSGSGMIEETFSHRVFNGRAIRYNYASLYSKQVRPSHCIRYYDENSRDRDVFTEAISVLATRRRHRRSISRSFFVNQYHDFGFTCQERCGEQNSIKGDRFDCQFCVAEKEGRKDLHITGNIWDPHILYRDDHDEMTIDEDTLKGFDFNINLNISVHATKTEIECMKKVMPSDYNLEEMMFITAFIDTSLHPHITQSTPAVSQVCLHNLPMISYLTAIGEYQSAATLITTSLLQTNPEDWFSRFGRHNNLKKCDGCAHVHHEHDLHTCHRCCVAYCDACAEEMDTTAYECIACGDNSFCPWCGERARRCSLCHGVVCSRCETDYFYWNSICPRCEKEKEEVNEPEESLEAVVG